MIDGVRRNTATTCVFVVFSIAASASAQHLTTSVSQHGITWTFDRPVQFGRFVNGDYWVVGPVTVLSVSPAPGVAPPHEVNDLGPNRWGDSGVRNDVRLRNGSMVIMAPVEAQGYDSRGLTYDASASVSVPLRLDVNRSLVSSISNVVIPNPQMHRDIMWTAEKSGLQLLKTAAVLTVLAEPPPDDAFRPTYVGGKKRIFRLSNVRWERLLRLAMDESKVPSWKQFERYVERPWIDHMNGDWRGHTVVPIENQPAYGRDVARIVSIASLMLHLDVPKERKRKLLIGLVQYGIDLRGIVELGGHWNEGGGLTSGRKWPILFAGMMLGEDDFIDMPSTALFQEDTQTYYGVGWAGQNALWQMVEHHGIRAPYFHVDPGEWKNLDGGWALTSEAYRRCCTIRAWPGQALAALFMGAKGAWNHDAFFDNVDDWMREQDVYAAGRDGRRRPAEESSSFDAFVDAMWRCYRSTVPSQRGGTTLWMWIASRKEWAPNPKPPSKTH